MGRRFLTSFLAVAALGATMASSLVARAGSGPDCPDTSSIGKSCGTAGPNQNLAGICESVACSADGGASAGDAGACVACLVDGTQGGCGGGKPKALAESFTPSGGCCSVAGTTTWGSGSGLLLSGLFAGAALGGRRRRTRV